jgi:hypothetical protein
MYHTSPKRFKNQERPWSQGKLIFCGALRRRLALVLTLKFSWHQQRNGLYTQTVSIKTVNYSRKSLHCNLEGKLRGGTLPPLLHRNLEGDLVCLMRMSVSRPVISTEKIGYEQCTRRCLRKRREGKHSSRMS